MRKNIAVLAVLAFIAILVAAISFFAYSPEDQKIRIGIVLPFSGSMAEYGQNGKNGALLAQEQLKRSGIDIELILQDTGDTPQGTVTAVRRLIDADGVQYIVGGLTSSGVLAAAPYAQERGVVFFTPAASAPGIPEIGDLIFRNWPADDAMARHYGRAAFGLGAKRIAILAVSNDYGKTNADAFAASFDEAGGEVAFRREFPQGTVDFRSLVAQLSSLGGFDHVFVAAYPDEYRAFFQELAKSTIKPDKIFTTDTFYSPDLIGELSRLVEGTRTSAAAKPDDGYLPRKAFIDAYQRRFKSSEKAPLAPGLVSDTAYDAVNLIVRAIQNSDGSPKAVARYLSVSVKNYPGAAGPTTFTASGDVAGSLALYQVRSGKFGRIGP